MKRTKKSMTKVLKAMSKSWSDYANTFEYEIDKKHWNSMSEAIDMVVDMINNDDYFDETYRLYVEEQ